MVLPRQSGYSHAFHATQPPWVTKMNVSMWVHYKHMLTDQQPSEYSHVTEQRHVKRSYDGTVPNESDAVRSERPHLWLDPTKLGTSSRVARAGEHGLQWSVGSRLTGFEKDRNSLGETRPRTCWIICDSVPVCVAIGRLRPCTPAELLGFSPHSNQKFFTSRNGRSGTTRLHR